jgi:predicted secreted Zn-dependent protease
MIRFKFIIAFLTISFAVPKEEITISWTSERALTWNDFKAKPQLDTDVVALTASGITFSYSAKSNATDIVSFATKVESHFYPNKSWFVKERANAYILKHEQLHFDITELYVRKLRQQISILKVSNSIKSQLEDLHQNINNELSEMQSLYDEQSQHSINKEEQAKWQSYVKSELKKLEAFKSKS